MGLAKVVCLRSSMSSFSALKSKKVKKSCLSKFCWSINLVYLTLLSQNTKLTHLYNYWRGNNWKSFARKSRNDRLGKASPSARALISALDSVMFWRRLPYLKILNNFALPIFFFVLLSFYVIPEIKNFKYLFLFIYFHIVFLFFNVQISGFSWNENLWFDFNLFFAVYKSSIREVYMVVKKRSKLTADLTEALLLCSVFGGAAAPRSCTQCMAGSPWWLTNSCAGPLGGAVERPA